MKPRESWSDTNLCYSNIFTLVSICLMFAGFRPRTVVIIPYPWTSDGCDPWLDKCHRVIELLVDLLGAVVHLMVCNHLASGLLSTLWYSIYD